MFGNIITGMILFGQIQDYDDLNWDTLNTRLRFQTPHNIFGKELAGSEQILKLILH